ncbi:hypothetical protein ACFPRL_03545 [Pseudoclavibacter helvolus]
MSGDACFHQPFPSQISVPALAEPRSGESRHPRYERHSEHVRALSLSAITSRQTGTR